MEIIVQKFGGTSVASFEARCAAIGKIREALDKGFGVVAVVSAMGRRGRPYATDTLIDVLKESNAGADPHEKDLMMCCGEIISACVFASELQRAGVAARALTGGAAGIRTDASYGCARILDIDTARIRSMLDEGVVPVVCGFQGLSEDGQFTTLGRGGSDTTAAALGAALKAHGVEIYTDVEGVYTADPRMVENAHIMDEISYGAVCELAYQGAKVIHPRAVEIARESGIPMWVKSTFADSPGTLITKAGDVQERRRDVLSGWIISGITYIDGIIQFRVALMGSGQGQKLFSALAEKGISVSCLNLSPMESMFCVYPDKLEECRRVLDDYGFVYVYQDSCAKVSVVGISVRGMPGLMAAFVDALEEKNIDILQTVDSDTTLSAVIRSDRLRDALVALHEAYRL